MDAVWLLLGAAVLLVVASFVDSLIGIAIRDRKWARAARDAKAAKR